jgi:hypothetical protein
MRFFNWIADHRPVVMFFICICAAICQYLQYRHVRAGLCKREDIGYFWRLWRQGERDGKLMIYLTFFSVALAALLIISLFTRVK